MILDPEDDVAHVKWGGKWRMPTAEEWEELMEDCTWEWVNPSVPSVREDCNSFATHVCCFDVL